MRERRYLSSDLLLDLGALGLLSLIAAGFFWRVLTSDRVYMPAGGGDLASFLYPMYSFIAASLRQGTVPLWNPYLYSGAPFAADIQTGLFYPMHLPSFLFSDTFSYRTLELLSVFHVWLAGTLMYACLRGLAVQVGRLPALAGAVAFMFSDLFIVHLGNLNMIEVAAWLPLIFLLFHRALAQSRLALAAGAGVVLAVAYYAGHIQPFLYILVCLGLYLAFELAHRLLPGAGNTALRVEARSRRSVAGVIARPLAIFAVMGAVGLGLAAPLLLPSMEMAGLSTRAETPYTTAMQYSLAPAQLVGLLVPNLLGRDPAHYWGPWDRVEVGYVGILPLILAGIALALRREPLTRFFGLLCALALFLAFGGYSVLQGWLHSFAPGFDMLRAPARFIFLLDFGLAVLAALGLDVLLRTLSLRQRLTFRAAVRALSWAFVVVAAIGSPLLYGALLTSQDKDAVIFARVARAVNGWAIFLVFAGLSLAWLVARRFRWLKPATLGWVALAIVAVDLVSLGANVDVGQNDPTTGFQHPAAVAYLRQDPTFYRIDTRTDVWDVWQPDLTLLYGIQDVGGIWNPLLLADYDAYWANLGSRSTPLYDFLNAAYIVGHKNVKLDMTKFVLAFDGDPQVNIYRNTRVLPRAQVVHKSQVIPRDQVLAALHAAGFHPAQVVILEKGQPLSSAPASPSVAEIVAYDANALQVRVLAAAPGYLVLSEVYYPGWRAWVDGQETEVLRANYAFRAVPVAPGEHHIRMVFDPSSWRWGLLVAGATWLAVMAGTLWQRWTIGRQQLATRAKR